MRIYGFCGAKIDCHKKSLWENTTNLWATIPIQGSDSGLIKMLIHRNATQWLPVRRIHGMFALNFIKKKYSEIINMDPVLSACVGGLCQAVTLIPNILFIWIPRAKGHADMGIIERDVIRIWIAMFTPSKHLGWVDHKMSRCCLHLETCMSSLRAGTHWDIFNYLHKMWSTVSWRTEYFATYWNDFYINALKQWTSRTEFNCCK